VTDPSDIELMLRVKDDQDALSELVVRYEVRLQAFIRRMIHDAVEAEDLFQETFVRVMRAAHRYEPRASFSTWIFTIARNLCIDRIKKKKGLPTIPLDYIQNRSPGAPSPVMRSRSPEPPGAETDPLDAADTAEQVELLRAAIDQLPETKREALVLRMQSGLPYAEIAEMTGAPVGTVKYRVHEAIRLVAESLGVPRELVNVRKSG
jgi:RNA polymerase sigma-70 factor (ECF subfamily)